MKKHWFCFIGLHPWPVWETVENLPDKKDSGTALDSEYRDYRLQIVQKRECPVCKKVEVSSQKA